MGDRQKLSSTRRHATESDASGSKARTVKVKLLVGLLLFLVVLFSGRGNPNRHENPWVVPCLAYSRSMPKPSSPAPPTKAPMAAPSDSVQVAPGTIQDAINSHGPDTSFLLSPGVYRDGPVTPKSGDRFFGQGNAVWDGGGVQELAFNSAKTNDVVVSGIRFLHFNPPNQGKGIFNLSNGESMFVIEGCEIAYNAGTPVVVGNGTQVINNSIHDNNWVGIGGYQVAHALIDHNELYNNYLADLSPDTATGEASAMKFGKTTDIRITNNMIHDNHGIGIWFDTDNAGTVIDSNVILYNSYRGIMEEISYGAKISNNIISGNGWASGWIAGGGIVISTASNNDIFGNTLIENAQGIIGFQQNRGSGSSGVYLTHENRIHDNFIRMARGVTGFTMGAETDKTNHFFANHYFLGRSSAFIWGTGTDPEGWMAAGQDKEGTFDYIPTCQSSAEPQ
jgi:parallel beta-helix repeat protein